MTEKKKDTRTRNWTIVIYPDSMPDNYIEIINSWHIEWILSPLHNADFNPDGEAKKPHYHVLLMFSSVKSYEQVLQLIEPLNCPIPKQVHNSKALVRYMAHLDNPEKAQYSIDDIKMFGGADVADLLKPNRSERYFYINEMRKWCIQYDIFEYEELFNYAAEYRSEDWFPLLCDNSTRALESFIKSRRHNPKRHIPNYEKLFEKEND